MKITLYTTHCPMCNVLEKKLQMAGLQYEMNEDPNEISKLGYLAAPLLKVDEDVYTFKDATVWLNNLEEEAEECESCKSI